MNSDYDLDAAYKIKTPEDTKHLYGKQAKSYDDSFGRTQGYVAPMRIAEIYISEMTELKTTIRDIGSGTGLVAENLNGHTVDGIDITPEMLDVAAWKRVSRNMINADLTKPPALQGASYDGIISCGTFAHGQVGPDRNRRMKKLLKNIHPIEISCSCQSMYSPITYFAFHFNSGV